MRISIPRLALGFVAFLATVAAVQRPGDLLARLKSAVPAERQTALDALAKVEQPDPDLPKIVAGSLLDDNANVRVAAAYAVKGLLASLRQKPSAVFDTLPKLTKSLPPVYPPDALNSRTEGVVQLSCVVLENGTVDRVEVLDGPPALRKSAVECAKKWRFNPATLRGAVVPCVIELEIKFTLGK